MKILKFTLFVFIVSITSLYSQGWDPVRRCVVDQEGNCSPNTLQTVTPFLRIAPDARGGGMGDAGAVTTPDANSIHYNISKLAFSPNEGSITFSYVPWLRNLGFSDVFLSYLSGYKKIDDLQTFGASFRYFSLGKIDFTDINGTPLGQGNPQELSVALAYARKLSPKFSAGIGAKYIYSNLASGQEVNGNLITPGNAFAADLTFTYTSNENFGNGENYFAAALALNNIGSKISYTNSTNAEFLPANMTLGFGLKSYMDEYNSFLFTLDIHKLLVPTPIPPGSPDYDQNNDGLADYRQQATFGALFGSFGDAPGGFSEELREFNFSAGVEYSYNDLFFVRTGYYYENPNKGDRQFLTLGVGFKYNVISLDISYLAPTNNQRSPLDNTLRFTLLFDFDEYTGG